jgi:CDP-diacylglycerol--glycerol-3-phosphate 3-phosphatidyltransferase
MSADAERLADERPRGASVPGERAGGGFLADLATIPNILSIFRLIGLPVAATLYIYGFRVVGLTLGIAAAMTDLLDGWLARKLNQTTQLGAVLDRLGDLVFEAVAFGCVVHFGLMTPVVFFAYLLREMVVLSARQFVAERGGTIATNLIGRLKTDFFALSFLLMFTVHAGAVTDPDVAELLYQISRGGIIGGLICSYWSGAQYLASFSRTYDQRR